MPRRTRPLVPLPPLVVLAEDNLDTRELYRRFLTFSGLRVIVVPDGSTVHPLALKEKPDLIVMDLAMPGVSGWEATRVLQGDRRTPRIPVLVISAHAFEEGSRAEAIGAGGGDCLSQPGR